MKNKAKAWVRGLVGGAIGGGCTAVLASLGLAGAAAIGAPVKPLDYTQLGTIFLSGSVINTLLFLKQSPLPPDNGDTQLIQKEPSGE